MKVAEARERVRKCDWMYVGVSFLLGYNLIIARRKSDGLILGVQEDRSIPGYNQRLWAALDDLVTRVEAMEAGK